MPDEPFRSRVPATYGLEPVRDAGDFDPRDRYGDGVVTMGKDKGNGGGNRDLPNKGAGKDGRPLTNKGGQPVERPEPGTKEPVDNRPAHPNFPGTVPDHQLPQAGNDDEGMPRK